jgi:probable phosphoglycerate mutase
MEPEDAVGTRSLWLVRHGESSWNAKRLVQGHSDRSRLTWRGRQQARQVARRLIGRNIDAVYSSDLRRARQTAAALTRRLGVEVRTDARLRERNYGMLEGKPSAALHPGVAGFDGDRIVDLDARPEGGESLRQLAGRSDDFVAWLRSQSRTADVAVVTHGGMIRALRASVLGVPFDQTRWDAVPNGSVLRLALPGPVSGRRSSPDLEHGRQR